MNETKNVLLSIKDVEARLGISYRSAYALFHSKGFPMLKFSRKLYVREASLERYLKNLEAKGA